MLTGTHDLRYAPRRLRHPPALALPVSALGVTCIGRTAALRTE